MSFRVGTVTATVDANTSPFMKALDGVKSHGAKVANQVGQKFQRVGSAFTSVGRSLTLGLTAPLMGAGALAVKTASDYERLRVSMDTLNGSAREGARNFERLKRFSAQTPFQLNDLAQAQNMLQGFGLAADDAFNSIRMIGDIAAVTGADISGIGIAFGQAAAEGKVMTRDIRQFINQGVPMIKLLADTMGVAQSEVLDLAEQGKISFDILNRAFKQATDEGGMFANGMKKQSETIGGLFSTLKDNVSLALGEIGQAIADEIDLKETVKQLTFTVKLVTKRFTEMSSESRGQIIRLAKVLAASGPLAIAIGQAAKFISIFAKFTTTSFFRMVAPIVGFIALVNEMTKALAAIYPSMRASFLIGLEQAKEKLGSLSGEMGDWMLNMTGAGDALRELNDALSQGLNYTDSYAEDVAGFSEGISRAVMPTKELAMSFQALNNSDISPLMDRIQNKMIRQANATSVLRDIADTFTNSFGQGMANIVVQGEKLVDVLKNIGKLLLSSAIQKGLSILLTGGLGGGGFFGAGGGLFGKLFGKLFHTGGIVGGVGEQQVTVRSGEGIFTKRQMAAMGNMQSAPSIDSNGISMAFEKALERRLAKLSPDDFYILSEKGRLGL